MQDNKLDLFAVVELFGHQKLAGKVTEQNVGSSTFVRIDVPETKASPSFTRLVNPSAVYAINPVTEEVANHMAANFQQKPIESWDIQKMHQKLLELSAENAGGTHSYHEDDLPM